MGGASGDWFYGGGSFESCLHVGLLCYRNRTGLPVIFPNVGERQKDLQIYMQNGLNYRLFHAVIRTLRRLGNDIQSV